MARYPSVMLVACPPRGTRTTGSTSGSSGDEVQLVLADGFDHAVRVRHRARGLRGRHRAVHARRARLLRRAAGHAHPMIGVDRAVDRQRRRASADRLRHRLPEFQISLPSWGPLNDDELLRFFVDVCGTFPDSHVPALQPAAHEAGPDRRRLRADHRARSRTSSRPRTPAAASTGAEDLLRHAPELMHFMGEGNFPHGAMFGSVGLLASLARARRRCAVASCSRPATRARRRAAVPPPARSSRGSRATSGRRARAGAHMDGAYDKMLVKLGMLPEFPLRLLSPYQSFEDEDYRAMKRRARREVEGLDPMTRRRDRDRRLGLHGPDVCPCLAEHIDRRPPRGGLEGHARARARGRLRRRPEPTLEALLARPDVDAVILATPALAASAPGAWRRRAPASTSTSRSRWRSTSPSATRSSRPPSRAGVVLTVNKVSRFREPQKTSKRLIDDGAIGELRMITGRHIHREFILPEKGGSATRTRARATSTGAPTPTTSCAGTRRE